MIYFASFVAPQAQQYQENPNDRERGGGSLIKALYPAVVISKVLCVLVNQWVFFAFFLSGFFFHEHSQDTGKQGEGRGIYKGIDVTLLYCF